MGREVKTIILLVKKHTTVGKETVLKWCLEVEYWIIKYNIFPLFDSFHTVNIFKKMKCSNFKRNFKIEEKGLKSLVCGFQ